MKKNTQLFVRLFSQSYDKMRASGILKFCFKKRSPSENTKTSRPLQDPHKSSVYLFFLHLGEKRQRKCIGVIGSFIRHIFWKTDKENSVQTQWKLLSDPLGSSDSHFFIFDRVEHTLSLFTIVRFGQLAFFFSSDSSQVSITRASWWGWRSSKVTDGC